VPPACRQVRRAFAAIGLKESARRQITPNQPIHGTIVTCRETRPVSRKTRNPDSTAG